MSKEFWFGGPDAKEKARGVMKEIRTEGRYTLKSPKSDKEAPKVSRGEKMANPTMGGGRQINSVSRSEMDRMSERVKRQRESEPKKGSLPPRPMTGVGKSAVDTMRNPFFKETDKFSGTGSYASAGGSAKAAAPKPKAKPVTSAGKPKAKPAMPAAKTAAPKPKAKPAASSESKTGFKGNWKGAAPTAMQARGGAKLKESPFQRMQRMQRDRGVGGK